MTYKESSTLVTMTPHEHPQQQHQRQTTTRTPFHLYPNTSPNSSTGLMSHLLLASTVTLKEGVIQGDPLAGLYFTLPLAEILRTPLAQKLGTTTYLKKQAITIDTRSHLTSCFTNRIINLQHYLPHIDPKESDKNKILPHSIQDLFENAYNMRNIAPIVHKEKITNWLTTANPSQLAGHHARVSGEAALIFKSQPSHHSLTIQDRYFQPALADFLMLPRTEAQELKSDKLLHCICLDNTNNEISQQHLRICKFGSKIINMHSVVVNELTTMCRQSGLTVQIEPRDLPNRNEGGDLKVTGITSLGKPLIIDVTIPCFQSKSNFQQTVKSEQGPHSQMEATKDRKYLHKYRDIDQIFHPFSVEQMGSFGTRAIKIMNLISKHHSKYAPPTSRHNHDNYDNSMWTIANYTSYWKTRIVRALTIAREQQIAHVTAEIRLRSGNYPAIIN
eukprot:m.188921 g.188921  ORF g.188921 m.188921 type:complete len:445 (+) comp18528_c0_seq48:663-1997(+)